MGSPAALAASLGCCLLAQKLTAGAFGLFRDSDMPLTMQMLAAGIVILFLVIRIHGLLGPWQEHRIRPAIIPVELPYGGSVRKAKYLEVSGRCTSRNSHFPLWQTNKHLT